MLQRSEFNSVMKLIGWIAFSGMLAMVLSIAEFAVVKKTSALTLVVAGIAKQIIIVALAIIIFKDTVTINTAIGFSMTILGLIGYNYMKLSRQTPETQVCLFVVPPLVF
eukprot:gene7748-382_t